MNAVAMNFDPRNSDPQSAYVHVPFCRHRCGYCNFTLLAGRDDLIEAYLEALAVELSRLETPRPVATLFLGGGTPSHLPLDELERLLQLVTKWFPPGGGEPSNRRLRLSGNELEAREFSVEMNPSDVTPQKIALLAEYQVNRISLGVQSFRAEKLTVLERDHSAETVCRAVDTIRRHIENVACDLIFAAPGETLADWERDLAALLALKPDHISTYGLTFEPGTTYFARQRKGELQGAEEELERAMYLAAIEQLTAAGFEHYEVSNFARSEYRCRHNEAYWLMQGHYAAGPGAARYIAGRREINHRSTTTWMKRLQANASPIAEAEHLPPEDAARERLVFGLRRLEGIDAQKFFEATGFTLEQLGGEALQEYVAHDLLEWKENCLRLTREGLLVSDSLWPRLLVQ